MKFTLSNKDKKVKKKERQIQIKDMAMDDSSMETTDVLVQAENTKESFRDYKRPIY